MATIDRWVQRIWRDEGAAAGSVRVLLAPFAAIFARVVAHRNARFDAGHGVVVPSLPVLSIGNLTVGGTGKTPLTAEFARRLEAAGAHPAIVLRGYGDDEVRMHRAWAPARMVIAAIDRVQGVAAAARAGADCVLLDDGFQHRRLGRHADVVLISADDWTGAVRPLPAGPWREGLGSLTRAALVVITVKAAPRSTIDALAAAIAHSAPDVPIAEVAFGLGALHPVRASASASSSSSTPDETRPAAWLAGRPLLAVSAIGDPAAFEAQLTAAGADVQSLRFRDHHTFDDADIARIRAAAGTRTVVCTHKDAVKLADRWPRGAPDAWYVSQALVVRRGEAALTRVVSQILAARRGGSVASSSAG